MMIKNALAKGKRVIFLVHYRQLAFQAMERFTAFGMGDDVGIIMAGEEAHYGRPVQIISIQTYGRRLDLGDQLLNSWFQKADLVFYDEAHASVAKTRKAILDLYKDSAVIVGLTATPCRADGRPLGAIYQDIITISSVQELTKMGYLIPAIYYGAEKLPDLQCVPIVAGDYNKRALGKRVDKSMLIGDILENWLRIAPERQTVVFAHNVRHSLHIKELFNRHGISCEHVDAYTPSLERQGIIARSESGKTQVVTNVGVYSEGADFPWVSCIILAKPTFSFMRYWQMAGRGLRPYPGKRDCIIIDHARNVERHGFMDDPFVWTLAGKDKAWTKPKIKDGTEKPPLVCKQCLTQFRGVVCPKCGLKVKFYGKEIACVEARLGRLDKEKKQALNLLAIAKEKKRFLSMAEWHCREKQYNPGWVAHTYKKKFKEWPPRDRDYSTIKPDKGFRNFLLYLWIRNNRGRNKKT
jgi:superfamily II DNA or RNA helicase